MFYKLLVFFFSNVCMMTVQVTCQAALIVCINGYADFAVVCQTLAFFSVSWQKKVNVQISLVAFVTHCVTIARVCYCNCGPRGAQCKLQ